MEEYIGAAALIIVAIIEALAARDRKNTKQLLQENKVRTERRERESRLSMELMDATCGLACDTARAYRDGHTNGTLEGNLKKAEEARSNYAAFIKAEAAHAVAKV